MIKVDVVNLKKEVVDSVEISKAVFGVPVNAPLVLQVIKAQLAGMRQGTSKNKVKSEVRGGGRKPFKQKGTGNARQGSTRSPLNPGGGSSFGPRPRSYAQDTPKKMVSGALRCVLSDKLESGRLLVIDSLKLKTFKTKEFSKILTGGLGVEKALIVDVKNENLHLATGNLPRVHATSVDGLNVYDMVKYEWFLVTKEAVKAISSRLA